MEQAVSLCNINRPNTCSRPDIQNRFWGRTDGSQMQFTLEQKKINMVHYIQPVLLSLVIRDGIFPVKRVSPPTTTQRRKTPPTRHCAHGIDARSQIDIYVMTSVSTLDAELDWVAIVLISHPLQGLSGELATYITSLPLARASVLWRITNLSEL